MNRKVMVDFIKLIGNRVYSYDKEIILPNIQFLCQLGNPGANGIVFKAKHIITNREEAIKFWQPRKGQKVVDRNRFLQEVRKIAKLNNENIVQVYDADILNENIYFMRMEYFNGETLKSWLVTEKPEPSLSLFVLNTILLLYPADKQIIQEG